MKYTPTYERIEEISKKLNINWQDAHQFAGVNNPINDNIVYNMSNWGKGDSMPGEDLYFGFYKNPIATKCICGYSEFKGGQEPIFTGTYRQIPDIKNIVICPKCGIGRLSIIPQNYGEYYTSGFFANKKKDRLMDFEHEISVAENRFAKIIEVVSKNNIKNVLDIGCAVGAFLHVLDTHGINAVGTEVWDSKQLYRKSLSENIYTLEQIESYTCAKYFDIITMFDVLEHVYDIDSFLKRIIKLLKSDGFLIIEIPNMGNEKVEITEKNAHHVKVEDFEHIWYFTEKSIKSLLESYDFKVERLEDPISGKMSIYAEGFNEDINISKNEILLCAENKNKEMTTVGLESGIGDVYWVLLKLKSFKEKNNIQNLKVYIQDMEQYNRALAIVECLDFVDSCEYASMIPGNIVKGISRNATVTRNGKQEKIDYYLCLSEILTHGNRIETWLPECKTDFDIKFYVEKPKDFEKRTPLVIIFPSSEGLAESWLNGFKEKQWANLINRLIANGINPIIVGSDWDKKYADKIINLIDDKDKCLSMVGDTTLPQVLYLLEKADLVIGAISGLTILANHFKTPTIALCPSDETFNEAFTYSWTIPGYKDYLSIKSDSNIADKIFSKSKEFLNNIKSNIEMINGKTIARIGVLPGIGDIYWCLLKLEDYKKKNNIDKLILYIYDSTTLPERNFNRAGRILDLVNFVDEYHYVNFSTELQSLAKLAASKGGSVLDTYIDSEGNNVKFLFLYPNPYVDKGNRIETWLPEYDINFDMQIDTQNADVPELKLTKQSPLILICSLDEVTCNKWLNGFGKNEWANLVETIAKKYKTKPIIIGAEWDKKYTDSWLSIVKDKKSYIDLVGKIDFKQTCGLFKRANLLISTISGASIVANHFKTPTIVLSPNILHSTGFTHSWIRPCYEKYYSINAFNAMTDTIIYLSDILLGKRKPKETVSIHINRIFPSLNIIKKQIKNKKKEDI
jgi:ADP-heptose:LPS heptosyltransferase/SAM-dependent methyltransferase